jgi:hypothetical protein
LKALLSAQALIDLVNFKHLRKIECDVFMLNSLKNYKLSPQVILATRLAIPEKIIKDLDQLKINGHDYVERSNLLPQFVSSAFPISNLGAFKVMGELGLTIIDANTSVAKKFEQRTTELI